MIRLWTTKPVEHFRSLKSATGGLCLIMEKGIGEGPGRNRSEVNKGVDGLAKPSVAAASDRILQQHYNTVIGKTEWKWTHPDYDYHQEIARSAYADMLHDSERNEKYYGAIGKAVQALRARGQRVQVLDIGTGTGLLSMMAAAEGADSITACEAFEPMASCAKKVIEANGYSDKISLHHGRSTDISVGEGKDMRQRANLLVTEVFDTELIGEGAIKTYTHAHEHLLQEDCLTVPRAANMYVQPVCSEQLHRWNTLQPMPVSPSQTIEIPAACNQCGGAPSLHDVHLDQISLSTFTPVCPPVRVFRFDYSKRGMLKDEDNTDVSMQAQVDGRVDAIFMWWDLEMDPEGKIILSCAPKWAHPLGSQLPWRDHWMQAIFYPSQRLEVKQGETFRILSYHDDYSLWFETASPGQQISIPKRPTCECGLHVAVSRSRLGMMNEQSRNSIFLETLRKHITSSTVCLCISDLSLLSIMAAKLGAKKVFVLDNNALRTRVLRDIIRENHLEEKIVIIQKTAQAATADDFQGFEMDLVIAEPYFQASALPWDTLHYWYAVNSLQPHLAPTVQVFPGTITVYAMAMNFKHLWKIRAPVGLCQGFMLNIFDKMISDASDIVDPTEEPHPLWEYHGIALSPPVSVLSLDIRQLKPGSTPQASHVLQLTCEGENSVNGVALWCDYDFGDGQMLSTGPSCPPIMGKPVEWNMYCQQAVYLTCKPCAVTPGYTLDFTVHFYPQEGNLKFDWRF